MSNYKYQIFTQDGMPYSTATTRGEAIKEAKGANGFVINLDTPYTPLEFCTPASAWSTKQFRWVAMTKKEVLAFSDNRQELAETLRREGINAYIADMHVDINPAVDEDGEEWTEHPYTPKRNPSPTSSDFRRGFKDGLKATLTASKYYEKKKNPSPMAGESDDYVAGFVTAVRMFAPDLIPSRAASWKAVNAILDGLEKEGTGPSKPSKPSIKDVPEVVTTSTGLSTAAQKLYDALPADGSEIEAGEKGINVRSIAKLKEETYRLAKAELVDKKVAGMRGKRYQYLWRLTKGSSPSVKVKVEVKPQSELSKAMKTILAALPEDGSIMGGGTLIRTTGLDKEIASRAVAKLIEKGKIEKEPGKGFRKVVAVDEFGGEEVGTIDTTQWKYFMAKAIEAGATQEYMEEKLAEAAMLAAEGPVIGMVVQNDKGDSVIAVSPPEEGLSIEDMMEIAEADDEISAYLLTT